MKKQTAAALFSLFMITELVCSASPVSAVLPTDPLDIPESGLWFRFDGDADEASGALTGKLRGNPRFVEGRDGTPEGAIYFETDSDAVGLYSDDIEGNWTASFWVKASDVPHHVFLCSSLTGSLRLIQDNGTVGATMNGIVDKSVPYRVPADTWTMLTFTYDNDMELTSVYVNGEFLDGMYGWQTLGMTLLGNDAPEQKGWQSAPQYAMDDAWFFGRLLTDAEILTLYETNTVPLPENPPEPEPEEPETPDEPESPEEEETMPEDDTQAAEEAENFEDEDGFDVEDSDDDPAAENGPRERKPGAFFAMGGILLAALFLVYMGGRALFGRRSK